MVPVLWPSSTTNIHRSTQILHLYCCWQHVCFQLMHFFFLHCRLSSHQWRCSSPTDPHWWCESPPPGLNLATCPILHRETPPCCSRRTWTPAGQGAERSPLSLTLPPPPHWTWRATQSASPHRTKTSAMTSPPYLSTAPLFWAIATHLSPTAPRCGSLSVPPSSGHLVAMCPRWPCTAHRHMPNKTSSTVEPGKSPCTMITHLRRTGTVPPFPGS